MFGYLKPDFKQMNPEDIRSYKAFYCSICHILKKGCGYRGICCLNYETVLITIIAMSVQPDQPRTIKTCCSITPFVLRSIFNTESEYIIRSAAISYQLMYYKVQDNIVDTKRNIWKTAARFLKPGMDSCCSVLGLNSSTVERYIEYISLLETDGTSLDYISSAFGLMFADVAEIICHFRGKPFFSSSTTLFEAIGKWIYVMDAVDDIKKDKESGSFNAILNGGSLSEAASLLRQQMEAIYRYISDIPLNCHSGIIKNVIDTMTIRMETVISSALRSE